MTPTPTYDLVLLDYGHGGLDWETGSYQTPGRKQYRITGGTMFYEGVSNREYAAMLANKLLARGVRVYDVVKGEMLDPERLNGSRGGYAYWDMEQRDVSLGQRVRNANQHPKETSLFVSLHHNAMTADTSGPSIDIRGGSIYTSVGETRSDAVATTLHDAFVRAFASEPVRMLRGGGRDDGDPDKEANFYVLRKTAMPALLGEILFYTNREDVAYLRSAHGREVITDAYVDGLMPWLIAL